MTPTAIKAYTAGEMCDAPHVVICRHPAPHVDGGYAHDVYLHDIADPSTSATGMSEAELSEHLKSLYIADQVAEPVRVLKAFYVAATLKQAQTEWPNRDWTGPWKSPIRAT